MYHNIFFSNLICVVIFFFALPFTLAAQGITIRGVVNEVGNNTKHIVGASVSLTRKSDSSLVKTAVSDTAGKFELIQVPPGDYSLSVYLIGFTTYTLNDLVVDTSASEVSLDEIRLVGSTKNLKEVIVIGKKALIEQQLDKIVVNVEASVSNVGSNVLEVLQKSPGVSIDKDGNIGLRGKQGVTIMIDGKPTYLSGTDLTKMLSNINASELSQIEIIANPGAKFDAAGTAGVINIKTKKNTAYGFNGSVTLGYGQGTYWRTNNSLNLNYRNKKINVFVNYGYGVRNNYTELDIKRKFFTNDGVVTSLYDQPSLAIYKSTINSLKLGMDYYISPKTTIGFVATGRMQVVPSVVTSNAHFLEVNGKLDSTVQSRAVTKDNLKNGGINLNLSHQFDSSKTLTADLDYLRYHSTNNQFFSNISSADDIQTDRDALQGNLPVNIDVYSGKVDYTQTFRDGLKMETGFKISQVKTNNGATYLQQDEDGPFLPDYGISNNFLYQENINAAYLNLSKQIKKWDLQAGLRFENTNYKGHQLPNPVQADSSFTRHYNDLFPTISIGYKINGDNEVNITFSRRIDRPAYKTLNPFVYYINKYTYETGNPLLLPQYANNFSIGYLYKGKFTATLSYGETSNYISPIFRTQDMVTIYTQENIGKLKTTDLSLNDAISVGKWWNINLNADLAYKKVIGMANGTSLDTHAYTFQVGANNQFTIAKGLAAELSGFYNSKDVDGQFTTKGFGQVSMGISKQVLNNKGSLKLNVNDIFYSQVIHGTILYNNVEESYIQSTDSRVVNLSFTYRFGRKLKSGPVRNQNSTEQEVKRINQ